MIPRIPRRLCGKEFNESNLQTIREIVRECDPPVRAEIARRACMALDWRDAKDRYKLMSSRVALLKLHRKGLIQLPPPLHKARNGRIAKIVGVDLPTPVPVELPFGKLTGLALTAVADKQGIQTLERPHRSIPLSWLLPLGRSPGKIPDSLGWRNSRRHRLSSRGLEA